MIEIINVLERKDKLNDAIKYFHSKWGSDNNFPFYEDAILNSHIDKLPCFYIALKNEKIIGSYALITNDFVSRHDLFPYFACLFVENDERGQKIGSQLMDHGCKEAKKLGYHEIYLTTDLENYYEKYHWELHSHAYLVFGEKIKIYSRKTNNY